MPCPPTEVRCMTPLHPDPLPTEGTIPATGTPAPVTTTTTRPAQRRGTPTDGPTTARTATAASRAGSTGSAPPPRGGRHAAPKTPRASRTAAAQPAPTTTRTATTRTTAAAAPTGRPTPFPRTPSDDRSTGGRPEVGELAPLAAAVGTTAAVSPPGPLVGLPASSRRRRSLCVAAALASVIGVAGGGSSVAPTALAGTEPTAVSTSVSVAEQLGITAGTASPVVDAETTDRLGDLVASRAERYAEQTQAARIQGKADRAAAVAERRAAIAAAEAARPKVVFPVDGATLTSPFGPRWGTLHAGIDLAGPLRTPEYAAMDGVVLQAGPASGFGLAVYVQHENGDVTVYGHVDEVLVSAGQVVEAGDTIALLGNTGESTGPHLHFEVRRAGLDGTPVDPIGWLRARGLDV